MIKTLVEFYDSENLENIFPLLSNTYDKVLFVSFKDENPADFAKQNLALLSFIKGRMPQLSVDFCEINEKKFTQIVASLSSLIDDNNAYDFNLTGGSEIVIAAIGHVVATSHNKNLSIHQYDIKSGKTVFRHPDYTVLHRELSAPKLSVNELISLQGSTINLKKSILRPDINKNGLSAEITRLWNAVKDCHKSWNTFCSIPYTTTKYQNYLNMTKEVFGQKHHAAYKTISDRLKKAGIMKNERAVKRGNVTIFTFTIDSYENAHFLYEKAGNLLEMYSYAAALDCGAFTDACVGVPVDWDGIITQDNTEPTNEIDLFLSTGHIPVCVSCKNCQVTSEYFYEIFSIAAHYGGQYAIPMIISTVKNLPSIQKRAKAMGILLIDNVAKITSSEFKQRLASSIR